MAESHNKSIVDFKLRFVNCPGEKFERYVGLGMQHANDRNFFSDKNDKNCHNCYFYEQTFEDESKMDQTTFLVHAKKHSYAGTELSMQCQIKYESFTKIPLYISKSKILNKNNCFLYKTYLQALAKMILSVDNPACPRSTGTLS